MEAKVTDYQNIKDKWKEELIPLTAAELVTMAERLMNDSLTNTDQARVLVTLARVIEEFGRPKCYVPFNNPPMNFKK